MRKLELLHPTQASTVIHRASFLLVILSFMMVGNSFGQVTCSNGLLTNWSFENFDNGWDSPNTDHYIQSSYVAEGYKGIYIDSGVTGNWGELLSSAVSATAGTNYTVSFWAGTHDSYYQHRGQLQFLNSSGAVIGSETVEVDHDVDPYGDLAEYNITAVAPLGTASVRFRGTSNGDFLKLDAVCLTSTPGVPPSPSNPSSCTCCSRTISNTNPCNLGNQYVVYLQDQHGGESRYFHNVNLEWEECGSEVHITGNVLANDGSGFIVNATLSGRTINAPSGSPKENDCVYTNSSDWVYYTGFSGTLTNPSNTNDVLSFTRRGPAFQVGQDANQTAPGFGGSGWFEISNNYWDIGDFNFMLSPTCSGGGSADIECPADITISCDESIDPSNTGIATLECPDDATITFEDQIVSNDCPIIIERTWTATYDESSSTPCAEVTLGHWNFGNINCNINGDPLLASRGGTAATSTNSSNCSSVHISTLTNDLHGGSSCVRGANGSSKAAVCIAASTSSSHPTNDNSTAEFTVTFGSSDQGKISGLSFYERVERWNENFGEVAIARKIGIRVFKNGTEIYTNVINTTEGHWNLRDFNFTGSAFEYSGATTFRFELTGFDPTSGFPMQIWELDELKVRGCCGSATSTETITLECKQTITIVDNVAPTLSNVPDDITVTCVEDVPVVPTNVTADDNCFVARNFTEVVAGNEPCDYTITRTWTATDDCNNSVSQSQVITVKNDLMVVATAQPSNICDGEAATLSATASKGCGNYTYLWSGPNGFSSSEQAPTATIAGTYSVTVSDGAVCTASATVDLAVESQDEITGIVWLDQNGNGCQDINEPVQSNIKIALYECTDNGVSGLDNANGLFVEETTTDADGVYLFKDCYDPNKQFYLQIQDIPAGFKLTDPFSNACTDNTDSDADPTDGKTGCMIAEGGINNKDFGLLPNMSIGSTVFVDADNDGIKEDTEAGIEGVTVGVYTLGADGVESDDDVLVGSDVTDMNGNYLVGGLEPGEYLVKILTPSLDFPVSSNDIVSSADPNNDVDNDDNGLQTEGPGGPVWSGIITLVGGAEPSGTDENGSGADQDDADDTNGNMNVDFGFYGLKPI